MLLCHRECREREREREHTQIFGIDKKGGDLTDRGWGGWYSEVEYPADTYLFDVGVTGCE